MSKLKDSQFEFYRNDLDRVKIRDIQNGRVVGVYFRQDGVYCGTCGLDTC